MKKLVSLVNYKNHLCKYMFHFKYIGHGDDEGRQRGDSFTCNVGSYLNCYSLNWHNVKADEGVNEDVKSL